MCGIFGVRGHPDAIHLAQLGLYSLQHRGQESFGIVSIDDTGNAFALRSMGTLSEAKAEPLEARDPRGWRPLAMGTLGGATVFASETCALDIIGATYVRDVEPGEIVAVDGNGVTTSHPFPRRELRRCVFEYVYFARPDSRVF